MKELAALLKPSIKDRFPGIGAYTPPKEFESGKFYVVARIDAEPESDGHHVIIEETRMPAAFFKITASPRVNFEGKEVPGFIIQTGTIGREFVAQMALAISDGMITVNIQK